MNEVTQAALIYVLLSQKMIPITNISSPCDWISNDYGNTSTRDSRGITTDNPPTETQSGTADSSKTNPSQLVSRPASEYTQIPLWETSGAQVLREFISQSLRRLTGAAAFTGLCSSKTSPSSVAVIGAVISAITASFYTRQLLQHQIGSASLAQKIGASLVSVTAMRAMAVYASFAKFMDLTFDLMHVEGWREPMREDRS